jgi:DNA-3-methyladenine glycosylase
MKRLARSFFQRDVLECARDLIGCGLVWGDCVGIIVETEAYAEHGDPACHTATRPSARSFIQSRPAGSAYVYFNYGMHWMLNLLTKSSARNGLILIRAMHPHTGIPRMRDRRAAALRRPPPSHDRWLCSGPGKLAAALGVTGDDHGRDLCARGTPCFLTVSSQPAPRILATPRIGISKATDFPWRFVLEGNPHVSRASS